MCLSCSCEGSKISQGTNYLVLAKQHYLARVKFNAVEDNFGLLVYWFSVFETDLYCNWYCCFNKKKVLWILNYPWWVLFSSGDIFVKCLTPMKWYVAWPVVMGNRRIVKCSNNRVYSCQEMVMQKKSSRSGNFEKGCLWQPWVSSLSENKPHP